MMGKLCDKYRQEPRLCGDKTFFCALNIAMSVQAVVFLINEGWTATTARKWLKYHKYTPIKRVHVVGNQLRYRIKPPTFKRYVTKALPDGVNLILGYN